MSMSTAILVDPIPQTRLLGPQKNYYRPILDGTYINIPCQINRLSNRAKPVPSPLIPKTKVNPRLFEQEEKPPK